MRAPQAPAGAGGGLRLLPLVSGRFAEQARVCPLAHGFAMATLRGIEANEVAAFQAGDEREQLRLVVDPGVVFVAHLVAGAVAPDDEPVPKDEPRPQ